MSQSGSKGVRLTTNLLRFALIYPIGILDKPYGLVALVGSYQVKHLPLKLLRILHRTNYAIGVCKPKIPRNYSIFDHAGFNLGLRARCFHLLSPER